MNNFNNMTIFSPTVQQSKSPIINLFFKTCLIALAFCLGNASIFAQPTSFTISGCTVDAYNLSGTYVQSATNHEGCPCYERTTDNLAIGYYPDTGDWVYSQNSCDNFFSPVGPVYTHVGCDITNATTNTYAGCDPATTLTVVPVGGEAEAIPTLSEWGLIILALMLMTAGTLYLVQPNWRKRFKQ